MLKIMNGVTVEMSDAEVTEFLHRKTEAESYERTRSFTESEALNIVMKSVLKTADVPAKTALRMVEFYPEWDATETYAVNDKVQYDNTLYRCITAHTAQEAWNPKDAASLWAKVLIPNADEVPEWEQPDSTNGYSAGDKVMHNRKKWKSDVDNNVWEPGVYGWNEVVS